MSRRTVVFSVIVALMISTCLLPRSTRCDEVNVIAHATILYMDHSGSIISKSVYRVPENLIIKFKVVDKASRVLVLIDSLAPYEIACLISPSGVDLTKRISQNNLILFTRKYLFFYPEEGGIYKVLLKKGMPLNPIHAIVIGDVIKEESGTLKPYEKISITPEITGEKLYALRADIVVMGERPRDFTISEQYSILTFNTIPAMGNVVIMNMSVLVFSNELTVMNLGDDTLLFTVRIRPLTLLTIPIEWSKDEVMLRVPRGTWLRILTPPHLVITNRELECFDPITGHYINGSAILSLRPRLNEYTASLRIIPRFEKVVLNISLPYADDFVSYLYLPSGAVARSGNIINLSKPTLPYLNISISWKGVEVDRLLVTSLGGQFMNISCRGRNLRIEVVDCKGDPLKEAMIKVYALELNEYIYNLQGGSAIVLKNIPPVKLLISVEYMGEEVCRGIVEKRETSKILKCNVTSFKMIIRNSKGELLSGLKLSLLKEEHLLDNYTVEGGMVLIKQIPIGTYSIKILNNLTNQCLYEGIVFVTKEQDVYELSINVHSIIIRVKDALGNPVEGVGVRVYGEDIDLRLPLNKNGEIIVDRLKPGTYTIEVLGHTRVIILSEDRFLSIHLNDIIFIGLPINIYLLIMIILLPLMILAVRIIFKWRETIIIR